LAKDDDHLWWVGDNKDEVYALKRVQVRIMARADEG
jgi:hypothetical protein